MSEKWVLIFSDGTGQRGVPGDTSGENTNVFRMFEIASNAEAGHATFYDAGLGAPRSGGESWFGWSYRLLSKATGLGVSRNIAECYAALMLNWQEDIPVGLFGFSRGAYTVRSLGGVLSVCGVPTKDFPRGDSPADVNKRYAVAMEAVKIYQIKPHDRGGRVEEFKGKYACADVAPAVIGVFDTVRALGLPGVMDVFNPLQHGFHDNVLSGKVKVGLHALAIDENRKVFRPEKWDEPAASDEQTLEQVWFPGVHSDIGGGYADDGALAAYAGNWLTKRLYETCKLDLRGDPQAGPEKILGTLHNERTGFGRFWLPRERAKHLDKKSDDDDLLCADIERRLRGKPEYRPGTLNGHPRVLEFYS